MPTLTLSASESAAEWRELEDPAKGFTVEYPASYDLPEFQACAPDIASQWHIGFGPNLSVDVVDVDALTLWPYVDQSIDYLASVRSGFELVFRSDGVRQNTESSSIEYSFGDGREGAVSMFLVQHYSYEISYAEQSSECSLAEQGLALKDIYYHMVKSFVISN